MEISSPILKDISEREWIKTLNILRRKNHTGIVVLYVNSKKDIRKSILIFENGGIVASIYEKNNKVFLGDESFLFTNWWKDCEGLMDVYCLKQKDVKKILKNYKNLFKKEVLREEKKKTIFGTPEGCFVGSVSLSLLNKKELLKILQNKKLNGYVNFENKGIIFFVEGFPYASIYGNFFGKKAFSALMSFEEGMAEVFEYPDIDKILKVGIPKNAVLKREREEIDPQLKKYLKKIPSPEEIDEIMRRLALKFGDEVFE